MLAFTVLFCVISFFAVSITSATGPAMNGALASEECPQLGNPGWDEDWTCASNMSYGTPYCRWPWQSVKDSMHRRRRSLPEGNHPYPGYKCLSNHLSHPNGCVYWGKILTQGATDYEVNYPVPLMEKLCPLDSATGCRTSPNYPNQSDGWPCGGCYFWVTRWVDGISAEQINIDVSYDSLFFIMGGGLKQQLLPSMYSNRGWTLPETKGSVVVRWEPSNWHQGDGHRNAGWKLCPKNGLVEACTCAHCDDDPNYRWNGFPCNHEKVHHFCNFKTAIGDEVRNACRETCMTCQASPADFAYPTLSEAFRSASLMDFSYGPAWKESVARSPNAAWARSSMNWSFGTLASGSRGPPWVGLSAVPGGCLPPRSRKLPTAGRCLYSAQCESDWCCPVYKVCLRQGPLLPPGEDVEIWLDDKDRAFMNGGVRSWTTAAMRYSGNHGHRTGWFDIATIEKTCGGKAWIIGDTFFLGRCNEVLFEDGSHGLVLEDMVINGKQYYAFNLLHPDCGCKMAFKEAFENNRWTGYFNENAHFVPLCSNPDENAVDCADGDAVRVKDGCDLREATLRTISGAKATVVVDVQEREVSIADGVRKQISSPRQDLFCKPRCPASGGGLPAPWPRRVEPWPEPIPAWYAWPPRHCVYTSHCQNFINIGQPEWVNGCMEAACADFQGKVNRDLYHKWAMEFCPSVCSPYLDGFCAGDACPRNGSSPAPAPEVAITELPDIPGGQASGCPLPRVTLPSDHELFPTNFSGQIALCAGFAACPVPGGGKSGGPVQMATQPACGVGANTAGPGTAPPPSTASSVQFSMTVEHVNYNALVADESMLSNFTAALKQGIADAAGDAILPQHVAVELSAGSVRVKSTITPDVGSQVTASSLSSSLSTATLSQRVVARVNAVPGVGTVTSGAIAVSNITPPTLVDTRQQSKPNPGLMGVSGSFAASCLLPPAVATLGVTAVLW